MPLFGRKAPAGLVGSWIPDFNKRFDQRQLDASGYPTDRVRWRGRDYSDPLPPGFSMIDMAGQQERARQKMSQPVDQKVSLPVEEAKSYVDAKLSAVIAIFAAELGTAQRQEFERALAAALPISCRDYLDTFCADASYRRAFDELCEAADIAQMVAWFWAIDPVFRLPPFLDEFLLLGGQMTLRNLGFLPTGATLTFSF